MDCTFITNEIATTEQMIENINSVLLKLTLNPRASYSIDTGQSKETVTVLDMNRLRALKNGLISDLQGLYDMCEGTGDPTYTRPGW